MSQAVPGRPLGLRIYQALTAVAGLIVWPWFYWRLRSRGFGESFWPRLGLRLPALPALAASPRLWLHGVSVGEIAGAEPLVRELAKALSPGNLFLSTGTETGQAVARRLYGPASTVFYYPLDLPWAVHRYLAHLRPSLFVALETEIWPNFLQAAKERRVKLALVNGRLSDHSLRNYLRFSGYLKYIINLFDLIATATPEDAQRFLTLGAAPARVVCTGNTKYERRPNPAARRQAEDFRQKLEAPEQLVFLAASTHPGEEEIILAAYQELRRAFPALQLWLAPRHPERATAVGHLLQAAGLPGQLWHRIKNGEARQPDAALIIDTVGDLFALYSLADLIFVGGSLVPHGGQNILEPATWGKVPLYGPHLHNFRAAEQLLAGAAAGLRVTGADSLIQAGRFCLEHPDEMRRRGQQGRAALEAHQGAAQRQAALLLDLLAK